MAYTALYRKKRPQKFCEIVGQPHVVRALVNQITGDKISHAYLFCGTRGTGKTTAAKIFARAVNCRNPQNGEPCNECEICLGILSERNLGVAEIDAASNNGVDNIRDLREEIKYPPTEGRYKVYIIDEVHMLSTSAFNALLKTLEEPPAHAVFVLATTDPQKIPATILSRCQRYDFKRITEPDMVETMRRYLEADGIAGVDDGALKIIASQSDGAMRDALSILDQALSLYNGELINEGKIYELLGAADRRVLFDFGYSLAVSDSAHLFEIINEASRGGRDMVQFTADLIKHFRDVLAAAQTGEGEELVRQAEKIKQELLIHWILTLAETQRDMRYAPNPRAALEITVLRLCFSGGEKDDDSREAVLTRLAKVEAQLERLAELEEKLKNNFRGNSDGESTARENNAAGNISDGDNPFSQTEPQNVPGLNAPDLNGTSSVLKTPGSNSSYAAPAVEPALFKKIQSGWDSFCKEFPNPMRSMLADCGIEQDGGFLKIVCGNNAAMEFIKGRQKILSEQMILKYGLPPTVNLAFTARDAYNKFTKAEVKPSITAASHLSASGNTAASHLNASGNTAANQFTASGNTKTNPLPANAESGESNPFSSGAGLSAAAFNEPQPDSFSDDDWASLGQQVEMSEGEF